MKRRRRKIKTVLVRDSRVKIYRRTPTVAGNEYLTFEVCDYTSGQRKLRSLAKHKAARREAKRIARLVATGDAVAAAMSGREAASFGRYLKLLRSVGDRPELACARYAEAVGILGNGSLLPTAAKFYLERHPNTLPQITLADAAAEMIELRRKENASEPYLADLPCRSARFIRTFAVHPASVTTADCQRYLDGLEGASGTKKCVSAGYLAFVRTLRKPRVHPARDEPRRRDPDLQQEAPRTRGGLDTRGNGQATRRRGQQFSAGTGD